MRMALAVLAAFHSANPASSCVNADITSLGSGSDKNCIGTSTFPPPRGWHCCGGVTQPTSCIGFNHFNTFPPFFKPCGELKAVCLLGKSLLLGCCSLWAARLSPARWRRAGMLPSPKTSALPRAAGTAQQVPVLVPPQNNVCGTFAGHLGSKRGETQEPGLQEELSSSRYKGGKC